MIRRRLIDIPGIGNTLATKLIRRGIKTRAQLRRIIDELPRETQANLRYRVSRSIPFMVGKSIAAEIKQWLTFKGPTGNRKKYPIFAVGSIRRCVSISKDIDVLIIVPEGVDILGILSSAEFQSDKGAANYLTIAESYASGQRRHSFIIRRAPLGEKSKYYVVDLFLATEKEKPFALFHYSNGRNYNIRVRAYAKRKGLKLDQYGIFIAGTKKQAPGSKSIKTERDLTRFLGVTYHSPNRRTHTEYRCIRPDRERL